MFGTMVLLSIVVPLYALASATILSLAQAWVLASTRGLAWRYVVAGFAGTALLVAPILFFLGFPGPVSPAHRNVAWTGVVFSAAMTVAVFRIAARLRLLSAAQNVGLLSGAWALFPTHVGLLAVFGTMELIILSFVFIGNIH